MVLKEVYIRNKKGLSDFFIFTFGETKSFLAKAAAAHCFVLFSKA